MAGWPLEVHGNLMDLQHWLAIIRRSTSHASDLEGLVPILASGLLWVQCVPSSVPSSVGLENPPMLNFVGVYMPALTAFWLI